jgi:hypothetical protein
MLLKLDDGSEEVRDVKNIAIMVDSWHLEIKSDQNPYLIHFHVPSCDEEFCNFVVHHRCANTMSLEIEAHSRTKPDGGMTAE